MRRILPALFVCATLGCTEQPAGDVTQAGTPADVAAVRAEIDRVNADISRWISAGQVDSIASVYASESWMQAPNMAPIVGRDSIAAMWRGMMSMGKWRLVPVAQEVIVSGAIAVERGTFEMGFERAANAPKGAPPSFTDRGGYVVLWVKEGDSWLLKWDIGSSQLAPGGTAAK